MQFFRLAKTKLLLLAKKKNKTQNLPNYQTRPMSRGFQKYVSQTCVGFVDCLLVAVFAAEKIKSPPYSKYANVNLAD